MYRRDELEALVAMKKTAGYLVLRQQIDKRIEGFKNILVELNADESTKVAGMQGQVKALAAIASILDKADELLQAEYKKLEG